MNKQITGVLLSLSLLFTAACAHRDTRENVELDRYEFKGIGPSAPYISPPENTAQIRITGRRISSSIPFAVTVGVPCSRILTERQEPYGPDYETRVAISGELALKHHMAVIPPAITTKESVLTELSLEKIRAEAKKACDAAPSF